jgi:hypothetical protein
VKSLKIYALALSATFNGKTTVSASFVLALSEKDARKHGLQEARRKWPVADTWHTHHVDMMQVYDNIVELAYDSLIGKAK